MCGLLPPILTGSADYETKLLRLLVDLGMPTALGLAPGPRSQSFSDRDGLDISDFSIHQQRACISISLYRTFISPLLARSRSRNTRALTLFTNNHIRIFAQDAWRKGKVHRWKGWLQGCGGEGPEVSQRKGWSAGELFGWAGGVGRRWKNLR